MIIENIKPASSISDAFAQFQPVIKKFEDCGVFRTYNVMWGEESQASIDVFGTISETDSSYLSIKVVKEGQVLFIARYGSAEGESFIRLVKTTTEFNELLDKFVKLYKNAN